jgi:hypothetical protein
MSETTEPARPVAGRGCGGLRFGHDPGLIRFKMRHPVFELSQPPFDGCKNQGYILVKPHEFFELMGEAPKMTRQVSK